MTLLSQWWTQLGLTRRILYSFLGLTIPGFPLNLAVKGWGFGAGLPGFKFSLYLLVGMRLCSFFVCFFSISFWLLSWLLTPMLFRIYQWPRVLKHPEFWDHCSGSFFSKISVPHILSALLLLKINRLCSIYVLALSTTVLGITLFISLFLFIVSLFSISYKLY